MGRLARGWGPYVPTGGSRSGLAVVSSEIGEIRRRQLAAHRRRRTFERDVNGADSLDSTRSPAKDAARKLAMVFDGVHDSEEIDVSHASRQSITAGSTGGPDDDTRPDEVRQNVSEKTGRDAHSLRNPTRTDRTPVVEHDEGERGPDGVVATTGQFDAHDRIVRSRLSPRKGRMAHAPRGRANLEATARAARIPSVPHMPRRRRGRRSGWPPRPASPPSRRRPWWRGCRVPVRPRWARYR